jgi:hypothetical protein
MRELGMILMLAGGMFIAVSFLAFGSPSALIKKMSDDEDDPDRELMLKTMGIFKWIMRFSAFLLIIIGTVFFILGGGFN